MKKLLIFIVSVSIAVSASSQDFFKQYVDPNCTAQIFEHVEYSPFDDVYYAVGSSGSFASIFKIDLEGNVICSSTFGTGLIADSFFDFVFAPNGDLMVVGTSMNNGVNDVLVYRVNQFLQPVWNNVNNVFTPMAQNINGVISPANRLVRPRIVAATTNTGNIFVVNYLSDFLSTGGADKLSMIAINGNGAVQWQRRFGTANLSDDQIYDMINIVTSSGNSFLSIVGNVLDAANSDAYIANLNPNNGNSSGLGAQWQYDLDNNPNTFGSRFFELKNDNGLIVCGSDNNTGTTGRGIIGIPRGNTNSSFFRNTTASTVLSSFVSWANSTIATTNVNPMGNAEVYVFGPTFLNGNVNDHSSYQIPGFSLGGNFKLTTAPGDKIILYGNQGNNAFMAVVDPSDLENTCNFRQTDRAFQQITPIPVAPLPNENNLALGSNSVPDNNARCQNIADATACRQCACPPPVRDRASDQGEEDTKDAFIEDDSKQELKKTFKVFPNPNSGQFEVKLEKEHGGTEINIYDTKGVLVKQIKLDKYDTRVSVSLGNVENGLYLIQVKSEKEILETQKVYIGKL